MQWWRLGWSNAENGADTLYLADAHSCTARAAADDKASASPARCNHSGLVPRPPVWIRHSRPRDGATLPCGIYVRWHARPVTGRTTPGLAGQPEVRPSRPSVINRVPPPAAHHTCLRACLQFVGDSYLDWPDGRVACRQLGFATGTAMPRYALNGNLPVSSGATWLNGLQCQGNETRLADCPRPSWAYLGYQTSAYSQAAVLCYKGAERHDLADFVMPAVRLKLAPG